MQGLQGGRHEGQASVFPMPSGPARPREGPHCVSLIPTSQAARLPATQSDTGKVVPSHSEKCTEDPGSGEQPGLKTEESGAGPELLSHRKEEK